jgi:integrase
MSAPLKLRYLVQEIDRHGKLRVYVRKTGFPKVALRDPVGSPEFLAAYAAAVIALKSGKVPPRPKKTKAAEPATLGWLVREYAKSHDFGQLDARSQRVRLAILEQALSEPPHPGSPLVLRDMPLNAVTPKLIKVLRDRKSATPGAANNRVRAFRVMFGWAVEAEHIPHNFATEVKTLRYAKQEFHTWTREEVKQFEARHSIGSKARLALALMLFTGVRRSDAVRLGPGHVKDGWITFTTQKTGADLSLPILPSLRAILDQSPLGRAAFLETAHGKPFTSNGFGNWFRDRCDEAGLPHCTAHGLRKVGAVIAAENGATTKQMMAIFGWETEKLAAHYSKKASQKKLAGTAMHLLLDAQEEV